MNLKQMLEQAVKQYGGKTVVVMGRQRLSYTQLDEASNKVANALLGMGVGKGDRVAMLLSNSPQLVTTYFGAVKIGGIAVPLDTKYKLTELTSLFNDSQPKVLVVESPYLEPIAPSLAEFKSITGVIEVGSEYKGKFPNYKEIMTTSPAAPVAVESAQDPPLKG